MGERLLMVWYEKVWLRYMRKRTKEISFHKSLMVIDAFTDNVAAAMLIGHTGVVKLPAGCTCKSQPIDVCINKPFKSIPRECYGDHVVKVKKDAGDEANNNSSFKFSSLTRSDIVK